MCYTDVAGRKKVHCGWVRGQSRSGWVVCTHCGCVGACTGGVRGWVHGWCAGGRAGASLSERAGCGCFCVRLSTSTNAAGTAPTVSGTHQPQQVRFFDRLFVCRCSVSRDDRSAPECIQCTCSPGSCQVCARARVRACSRRPIFTSTTSLQKCKRTLRLHSPRQYETGPLAALGGQVRELRLYDTCVGPARSTGWFST